MCEESYAFPRYWHPAELQRSFAEPLDAKIVRECLKARVELLNGMKKKKLQAHYFEPLTKEGSYFDNLSFYLLNAAIAAKFGIDSPAYEHYMKVERDLLAVRFRHLGLLSLVTKLEIVASLVFAEKDIASAAAPLTTEDRMVFLPETSVLKKEHMSNYVVFYYSTGWRLKNKQEPPYDPTETYATFTPDDLDLIKRNFKRLQPSYRFKFSAYDIGLYSVQLEDKTWALPLRIWEPLACALFELKESQRVLPMRTHKDVALLSHRAMRDSYEEIYRTGVDGQNAPYTSKGKTLRDCWIGLDLLELQKVFDKFRAKSRMRFTMRPPGIAYLPFQLFWSESFVCEVGQPKYKPSNTAVEWMRRNWCDDIASLCKFTGESPLYLLPTPKVQLGVSVQDKQLAKLAEEQATSNFRALENYLPPCIKGILDFDSHLGYNTYAVVYVYYKAMGLSNREALWEYVYKNKPQTKETIKRWEEMIDWVVKVPDYWKWQTTCDKLSSQAVHIRAARPELICPYSGKNGPSGCCEAQFGDTAPVDSKRFRFPSDFTLFRFEQVKQQQAITEAQRHMEQKRALLAKAKEETEQVELKHKAKIEIAYEEEPKAMDTMLTLMKI